MQFDAHFEFPALAALCALVAAFFDIKSRRIPNLLVGPALLAGLLLHFAVDGGHGLLDASEACLAGGAVFLIFYALGGMGAGDVKLVATVCAIAGLSNVPFVLVLTGLAGGVMAVVLAAKHGRLRQTLVNVVGLTSHHLQHGLSEHPELNVRNDATLRLPYGVAVAVGCTATLWICATGR